MNKICIIIPTCNRSDCISYYLENKAKTYSDYGIDMIIFDSSSDGQTERETREFIERGFSNVKYVRYDGQADEGRIDQKVFAAARAYCHQYEYLCFSGDGTIVHLEVICAEACKQSVRHWDVVIYDNDVHMQVSRKEYTERSVLFRECCWRMTLLSSMVLSGELLGRCTEALSPDHELWLPMALFYTPAEHIKNAVYLADTRFWEASPNICESFWKMSGNALRQWGQIWCNAIDALPTEYDQYKGEVLRSHDRYTSLFSIKGLVHLNAFGNITYKKVKEFRPYLPRVTATNPIWFYIVALGLHRRITYIIMQLYHLFSRRKV